MRKLTLLLALVLCVFHLSAQDSTAEAEVRQLEETERRAVLKSDTVMLRRIWDKYLIVNSPDNRIMLSVNDSTDDYVIVPIYSSFTREIEQIIIKGDIVLSMGNEVIVPEGNVPNAGQTVKRRYTNVWMKESNTWKLFARHVNVVCE